MFRVAGGVMVMFCFGLVFCVLRGIPKVGYVTYPGLFEH